MVAAAALGVVALALFVLALQRPKFDLRDGPTVSQIEKYQKCRNGRSMVKREQLGSLIVLDEDDWRQH